MGAGAGQSNDRWSSCADGYYQANDNDTNVNDDDNRNNNDNPMAYAGSVCIRVFLKGHFVKKKNVHPTT